MLRKYIPDPSHVLDYSQLELDDRLTVEEQPVNILDREERVLRSRSIPFVKVAWSHHPSEDVMWECEDQMRELYPHLFGEHSAFQSSVHSLVCSEFRGRNFSLVVDGCDTLVFQCENLRITSGFVKVFSASAMTKDEFRSSPVTFLGFSALVAAYVGLPSMRRTY